MKKVMILTGTGELAAFIASRLGAGMKIVVFDKSIKNANSFCEKMDNLGLDCVPVTLSSQSLKLTKFLIECASKFGEVTILVNITEEPFFQATIKLVSPDFLGEVDKTTYSPNETPESKTFSVAEERLKYGNAYKSWTEAEEQKLIQLFDAGYSVKKLMELFNRSYGAIRSRLRKLGKIE